MDVYTGAYVYLYLFAYMYIYVSVCVCNHVLVFVCANMCTHAYMCMCAPMCMFVCEHLYTHSHIDMQTCYHQSQINQGGSCALPGGFKVEPLSSHDCLPPNPRALTGLALELLNYSIFTPQL